MVQTLREAEAGGAGSETERYMRLAMLRYLLLQHVRVDRRDPRAAARRGARGRSGEMDTMVHQFLKELR